MIWSEVTQGGQSAVQNVLDELNQSPAAGGRSLTISALEMIFGRESVRKFATVRGRGNQAAHEFDHDTVVMSVTQVDLKPAERDILEDIFQFVLGAEPSF
jgi:hypothetical protein